MAINIQNMCGNGGQTGGQTGGGAVNKVNGVAPGADGNVRLTADNLGAALAATNIRSVTKKYRRFISQDNEDVTPKDYLWALGKGSFFLRTEGGVHFVACVDIADGLKARIYAMIPPTSANDGDVIDGGVYVNNTKLAAFGSTEDLQELILKIGDSPVATEAYVRSCIYCADYNITEFAELLPVYAAGAQMRVKMHLSGGAVLEVPLAQVRFENNAPAEFIFAGTGSITIQSGVIAANVSHVLFDRVFCAIDAGGWSNAEEGSKTEVTLEYADADVDIIKSLIDAGFEVSIIGKEIIGCMLQTGKLRYVSEENFMFPLIIKSVPVTFGYLFTGVGVTNHHYADDETGYDLVPEPRIVYAYFSKDTTTSPATKSKIRGQYLLSTKEYVNTSISNAVTQTYNATMTGLEARLAASSVSPIDLTAEYAEWLYENSTGTPDMFFMTVTDAGVYTMSDSTGLWHCCRVIRASDGDDAELYRLIYSMGAAEAAASIRLLNVEHPTPLVCDNKINFTRGISVPTPVGAWDATPMSYVDALRASHRAMIVARPTTAQARQIADEAVAARLPLGEMSTVSTRLEKCSVDRVRYIRVDLMNNDFLRSLHEAGNHISLHFLMCSRKRGRGHHWWHPSNYDHEPTGNEPFRLGYASMAGKRINDFDQTVFPPVPDWMPGDGWMQTELTIGADDLDRGYVLIDPATYFLPMVKPSVYGQDGNWGENISVVSTRRKDAGRKMPFVCTWQVAVNGVEIGRPLDVLRVGCSRNSDSYNTTTLQIVDGNARVVKLYTSVSR